MIDERSRHVLIAGLTTRALAISAARAGYRVTAVDAFGDLDLRAVAEVIALRPESGTRFSADAAAAAAKPVRVGLAAYTSNFENYPQAVAALAERRCLLGNAPEVLMRARDPINLARLLRRQRFATPKTRATAVSGPAPGAWLLKPRRSGGGHGTTIWRRGQPVPRTCYLQERITGIPGSIVFAADGRNAVPLGLARQLVADSRLGAQGFRYCGSMLGGSSGLFPHQERLFDTATSLAAAVTAEFGLVGLNGLDFIERDGVPYPIEVNPRFSASMELIERAQGLSVFQIHERACRGFLPSAASFGASVQGKAIVFARRDVTLGDTRAWMGNGWLADIPQPGEHIRQGHPICTVFAGGEDDRVCHRLLMRRANTIYRAAESRKQGAA